MFQLFIHQNVHKEEHHLKGIFNELFHFIPYRNHVRTTLYMYAILIMVMFAIGGIGNGLGYCVPVCK